MNRGRLGLRGPRTSVGSAVVSGEVIADLSADPTTDLSAHISANLSTDLNTDPSANLSADLSADPSTNLSAHISADLSAEAVRLDFCGVNDVMGSCIHMFRGARASAA